MPFPWNRSSFRTAREAQQRTNYRRFHPKERERNFFAAGCSMIVIVLLSTSLAEPKWISMQGGGCNLDHLGVYQFFYSGYFSMSVGKVMSMSNYHYTSNSVNLEMINCVTPQVVTIMKSIIGMTFLGILLSITAFLLDLLGPSMRALKIVRRNAIPNILTVIVCVIINGFCFWATGIVLRLQSFTKPHEGSKVIVTFDASFYLIVSAGACSVIATACNCLKRHPPVEQDETDQITRELMDDIEDIEIVRPLTEPPPPPYVP